MSGNRLYFAVGATGLGQLDGSSKPPAMHSELGGIDIFANSKNLLLQYIVGQRFAQISGKDVVALSRKLGQRIKQVIWAVNDPQSGASSILQA